MTLLSLDVSTSSDQRRGGSPGAASDLADERDRAPRPPPAAPARPRRAPTAAAAVTDTVELPDGLLVDVLA